MNHNPLEQAYSTHYAQRYLYARGVDVTEDSLRKLARSGKMGHKRNGENWYFSEDELDEHFIHSEPPCWWLIGSLLVTLVIVVYVVEFL